MFPISKPSLPFQNNCFKNISKLSDNARVRKTIGQTNFRILKTIEKIVRVVLTILK
jgi:hypothetical protein